MCNYLPSGVIDSDPAVPWNRAEKPEPESLGSDCCGAPVLLHKGFSLCMECGNACVELLESDEEMYARIEREREWLEV